MGTFCLIHQPSYSMPNRWVEDDGPFDTLDGWASAPSCVLASVQGMLTTSILPHSADVGEEGRRRSGSHQRGNAGHPRAQRHCRTARAGAMQMALAGRWEGVTSALCFASSRSRLRKARLRIPDFSDAEFAEIDTYARDDADINLWRLQPKRGLRK